jgi:hypothetical protein
LIAWDQMNVQVRYGLSGSSTVVDADVVALRAELFVGDSLDLVQQGQKICAFICFKLKERAYMALGDDQGVTGGDREGIPYDQPQRAGVNDSLRRQATEKARLHAVESIASTSWQASSPSTDHKAKLNRL